ncbi:MAG: hypothetical protein ABI396_17710 [Ktedonobacteraceae bacterium]
MRRLLFIEMDNRQLDGPIITCHYLSPRQGAAVSTINRLLRFLSHSLTAVRVVQ